MEDRCVRTTLMAGSLVLVQVDTAHKHGCVDRCGDDDFLRAALQVW